jgi:hypothetical protein
MKYENAKDLLPKKLYEELQRYASGKLLYVPSQSARRPWGESTGYRRLLGKRNAEIRRKGESTMSYNENTKLSQILSEYPWLEEELPKRYPELKASDLYKEAQEGMKQYEENVRLSRMVYNDTATKMNRMVRQWPSSIVASMLHFDQKDYLKVDSEEKKQYPNLDEAFKK